MTADQLNSYRNRLWRLVGRMQRDASAVSKHTFGPISGQAAGELSNSPMHPGDAGTEAYLQEVNATLLENQEFLLQEALAASRRIDEGTFGRCENCGQAIVRARLDAIPFARHCTSCAEALDRGPQVNLNAGRPVGTIGTGPPRSSGADRHAAGTAGGGTAVGGLAGTNSGHGEPDLDELEMATASSHFDAAEADDDEDDDGPRAAKNGGAARGTPLGKRARGTRASRARRLRRR